jgi:hypothetical protein
MPKDEFAICTLKLGKTRVEELRVELCAYGQDHHGQGLVVGDVHYYTTRRRKACIAIECQAGVVHSVRLKMGLWGPLAELDSIPPEAISDCSLECLGTWHRVHLMGARADDTRERVLAVYGSPTSESDRSMQYRWLHGSFPRALTVGLNAKQRVTELFLERLPDSQGGQARPLGTMGGEMPRILPPGLDCHLQDGGALLRSDPQAAEQKFQQVLDILEDDDPIHPSFNKAYVRAYRALARALQGQSQALTEVQNCRDYLRSWDGDQGFFFLTVSAIAARVSGVLGNTAQARSEWKAVWSALQDSPRYDEPWAQALVREANEALADESHGRDAPHEPK